jgi:hypothetical protein
MLRQVLIHGDGLIAAFDENGKQVPEAQGDIVEFYYRFMKEKGLADGSTTFELLGTFRPCPLRLRSGDDLEKVWRPLELDPTS